VRAAALSILLACEVAACSERAGTHATIAPPAAEAPVSAAPRGCGGPGEPDCPLRTWMRSTLQAYLLGATPDPERLAASLDKLAGAAPSELPLWGTFARRGAEHARKGDLDGVKKVCAECHNTYRTEFQATMRTRRLF
jgi:hypothetical protein